MSVRIPSFDVIVAGSGPVGLFLACELRLAGVSVLVLEQAADPSSPLKGLPFGLRGLSTPTLEALYRRDLLADVEEAARHNDASGATRASAHWQQHPRRPTAGHFAGIPIPIEDVDAARWPFRLPGPVGYSLAVDMQSLEAVLTARAVAAGVTILRGTALRGLDQASDGVLIRTDDGAYQARWLVGCDGGRSTVRNAAGFAFVGTDPEFTGYSVDVALADSDALAPGRTYTPTGMYTYAKPGTIAMVDFDGGAFHRSGPITLEHVQTVLRRVSGTEVSLTALRLATTWTDRARQASAYRHGRVLLAGDAAHIHSPLGGQGLNLGLGDAMNLGWKLAATVRGDAPEGLLDSYMTERHPEGARILAWSRAQVALMRPTPGTRALAEIIRGLAATRDGATYFAESLWGVSLRYDLGADHPLVGRSVPDFELDGSRRVGGLMRDGKGVLLDFAPGTPLRPVAARWRNRVTYATGTADNPFGFSTVLVRPDGFVAWATDARPSHEAAAEALTRWFGPPAHDRPV